MKFNLNNYVQIKLTEKGKQVLKEKIENDIATLQKYGCDPGGGRCNIALQMVENSDCAKFQLWEVMQIFGPYMKQGSKNVIDMDIVLEGQEVVVEENSLCRESLFFLKEEIQKARKKFPGAEDLTVALMEEAGELAQATLKCDSENIKKEALQVACVAMRIFEEGDSTFTKRVGISQDEKYEYEKELRRISATLLDCGFEEGLYWFNVETKNKEGYIFKNKKKPTVVKLRSFVDNGKTEKGWVILNSKGLLISDGG